MSKNWLVKISMTVDEAYAFMGLRPGDVTEEEFKSAYRRLAMEFHPDRQQSDQDKRSAEVSFKQLQEAKDHVLQDLQDPSYREKYEKQQKEQSPESWHETNRANNSWVNEYGNIDSSLAEDMERYTREIANDSTLDWLDEAGSYDQENHFFSWRAREREQKKRKAYHELLSNERNRLPPPELMAQDLFIDKARSLDNFVQSRSSMKNDKNLKPYYEMFLRSFLGEEIDNEVFNALKNAYPFDPYQFNDYGIAMLASLKFNKRSFDEEQMGYSQEENKEALDYLNQVRVAAHQMMRDRIENSIVQTPEGLNWSPQPLPSDPAKSILHKKLNKFFNENWQLYEKAAVMQNGMSEPEAQMYIYELASSPEHMEELRKEFQDDMLNSLTPSDDDYYYDDLPNVAPFVIDYTRLENLSYVLDLRLMEEKEYWEYTIERERQYNQERSQIDSERSDASMQNLLPSGGL